MKVSQLFHVGIIKTIWFNFRYFPFNQAYKLPVLIARKVQVRYRYRGFCEFLGGKIGLVQIGFGNRSYNPDTNSSVYIKGETAFKGLAVHSLGPGTIIGVGKEGVLAYTIFVTSYFQILFNGPRRAWRYGVKMAETEVPLRLINRQWYQ